MITSPGGHKKEKEGKKKDPPGSYQRLDLFIKVLWVLCPNLTDASLNISLFTGVCKNNNNLSKDFLIYSLWDLQKMEEK